MKVKKSIVSILVALMMVFAMAPVTGTVYAEDNSDAIQFVNNGIAMNISGRQESNVYFGNYMQSSDGNGGFNMDPIKWRVLQQSVPADGSGRLFLFSDALLDVKQWDGGADATWETCSLRAWLNGDGEDNFINKAFSEKEQTAIPKVLVWNEPNPLTGVSSGNNTYDKIYLLSMQEAADADYGFPEGYGTTGSYPTRAGAITAYAASYPYVGNEGDWTYWWLRTSANKNSYTPAAAVIYPTGEFNWTGIDFAVNNVTVRPAFNLDLDTVLFTSAAEGGKVCGEGKDALTEVGSNTTSDWKLTLLDDGSTEGLDGHKGFTVDKTATCDGKTLYVKYHGAVTGDHEYISAIIADPNENIKYYGRVKKSTSDSDIASINIDGLLGSNDKVYVFNEQYNGDRKTDYASALEEITIPEPGHTEESIIQKATLTLDGSIVNKCSMCGEVLSETVISHPDKFSLSPESYTYDGSKKEPAVTVTDADGKTIGSSNYTVSYSGNKNAGKAEAKVSFKGDLYEGSKSLTFTINKADNPLTIKPKTATVKYSKLRKKSQTLAVTKVIKFTKDAKDKKTYTLSYAKKGKKSFRKYFKVNKSTGKVTMKKGLKKGTYKVKVKVKALGNKNYKASAVKTVTFKVKVK